MHVFGLLQGIECAAGEVGGLHSPHECVEGATETGLASLAPQQILHDVLVILLVLVFFIFFVLIFIVSPRQIVLIFLRFATPALFIHRPCPTVGRCRRRQVLIRKGRSAGQLLVLRQLHLLCFFFFCFLFFSFVFFFFIFGTIVDQEEKP